MGAPLTLLGDNRIAWNQLRGRGSTFVTADDTPLALATSKGDWENKPTQATEVEVPGSPGYREIVFDCVPSCTVNVPHMTAGKLSTVEIIGWGSTTADQTCAWILYAWRGLYSPAVRIAAGTAILGTMDVVKDPVSNTAVTAFYIDTFGIGASSNYWGSVAVKDDADNACSRLIFDFRGYIYLNMEVLPTSGTCTGISFAFSGV